MPKSKNKAEPGTWWKWLLMYPAVCIAIISAIPTWYDRYTSYQLGVPADKVQIAQDQWRLWKEGADCLKGQPIVEIPTSVSYKVSAVVCERTGNVLVMITDNEGKRHSWWVEAKTIVTTASRYGPGFSLVTEARAAEVPSGSWIVAQDNRRVICQKRLDSRKILLRISTNAGCIDEIIDTYTGAVVRRQPAACNPDCK